MWINDASYSFPQQTGSENGVGGIGIIDLVFPRSLIRYASRVVGHTFPASGFISKRNSNMPRFSHHISIRIILLL